MTASDRTAPRQSAGASGAPKTPRARSAPATLDDTDRKLLALLAEDATRTYAELGKLLFLSAPAVHERARRLKKDGVIKGTVAALDAAKLNRPLLAFVHVDTTSWAVTRQLLALEELSDVEEIHTVTGESAMLLKVRTRDTQSLEQLLGRIHAIEGFTGTRSYIALTTYLERGPSPDA
ncbi:Lrp/AsnC family transcriptional regulator [Paraburkholderia sp. PREW-6R]|uniref:Lrp/AsnC family transcriptional regulator n=1 Tax=Paraburkholderia sp. PREW-6R TaxID=3141544 RepID=UPI0031F4DE53